MMSNPSNPPFLQTGSYPPPPQQQTLEAPQPPKNEIETFNRRYIPLFFFLISFAIPGFLFIYNRNEVKQKFNI